VISIGILRLVKWFGKNNFTGDLWPITSLFLNCQVASWQFKQLSTAGPDWAQVIWHKTTNKNPFIQQFRGRKGFPSAVPPRFAVAINLRALMLALTSQSERFNRLLAG